MNNLKGRKEGLKARIKAARKGIEKLEGTIVYDRKNKNSSKIDKIKVTIKEVVEWLSKLEQIIDTLSEDEFKIINDFINELGKKLNELDIIFAKRLTEINTIIKKLEKRTKLEPK